MLIPEGYLYNKSHEWAKIEGDEALMGISDFAQSSLGDITYVELPEVGSIIEEGDELGFIESVKAASELYSPISGEVIAVNVALSNNPELINKSPYEGGWIMRVKLSSQPTDYMQVEEYEALCLEEQQ